jgi:hypothetical protein
MTPTTYQQRFITHVINLSKIDKDLANYSIREFATLDPYQLKDLRALVMLEVKRLKSAGQTLAKLD